MPASAIPFIVAIVAAFSVFILVVGSVSIWTESSPHGTSGSDGED